MSAEVSHLRHELRTPVNHVAGYAELLLEDGPVPDALAGPLRELAAAARASLATISGIVDASEAGLPSRLSEMDAHLAAMSAHLVEAAAAGRPSDADDLGRISEALRRLRDLIDGAGREATAEPAAGLRDDSANEERVATVLVVDDDAANRDLLSRRVERLGYRTRQAADGFEALAAMAEGVDLVLLDIMMPGLDGYGVLDRRRVAPRLREIPVIVISALDNVESVVRCIEAGADDYLSKPFDPVLLRARVGACIEQKRLRDDQRRLTETVAAQADELRRWNAELEARVAEKAREVSRLSLMQRFVAPQLLDALAAGGEAILQSHRREIAVLFCDLRGFTSFAEQAEPEDVMAVLHDLHAAVGPRIFHHGGTLAQFTGDGMMVFFNDPVPCVDPAGRAVALGLDMRDAAATLAGQWRARGHELALGVGIAIGHATCGQIGFEGRFEYTAIGTVTNLAARLCGEARGGQVLVTQRVANLSAGVARFEPAGEIVLKGISRPVATCSALPTE